MWPRAGTSAPTPSPRSLPDCRDGCAHCDHAMAGHRTRGRASSPVPSAPAPGGRCATSVPASGALVPEGYPRPDLIRDSGLMRQGPCAPDNASFSLSPDHLPVVPFQKEPVPCARCSSGTARPAGMPTMPVAPACCDARCHRDCNGCCVIAWRAPVWRCCRRQLLLLYVLCHSHANWESCLASLRELNHDHGAPARELGRALSLAHSLRGRQTLDSGAWHAAVRLAADDLSARLAALWRSPARLVPLLALVGWLH